MRVIKDCARYKRDALRRFAKVAAWMDDKEFKDFVNNVTINRITLRHNATVIADQVMAESAFLKALRRVK